MKSIKIFLIAVICLAMTVPIFARNEKVTLDGSTTVGPLAKAFAEYYMKKNRDVSVEVSESGSGNGAKGIINGTCNIGNMSRFMKDKEFKAAVENSVKPVAHIVALDGIAIVINKANRIKNLTIEQVRKLYTGEIKNWKEIGGSNKKVVLISRESNSGTLDSFKHFIMKYKKNGKKMKAKISAKAESQGSNGAVKQSVQKTTGAIGFIGLGFVDKSVKAINVNNVKPTMANVKSGKYPISRPLYMFTNGYPELGSHLQKIVSLYLTKDGQKLVEKAGYIPLTDYK